MSIPKEHTEEKSKTQGQSKHLDVTSTSQNTSLGSESASQESETATAGSCSDDSPNDGRGEAGTQAGLSWTKKKQAWDDIFSF